MARKLGGNTYNPNRDPLRRIVGHEKVVIGHSELYGPLTAIRERLECGHIVRVKEDIFGQTNANSRRCRECAKASQK